MVRKVVLAVTAAALTVLPIAGHAAAPQERVAAEMDGDSEELVGLLWHYIVFPVVIAAVLALLLGGSDDETPASP